MVSLKDSDIYREVLAGAHSVIAKVVDEFTIFCLKHDGCAQAPRHSLISFLCVTSSSISPDTIYCLNTCSLYDLSLKNVDTVSCRVSTLCQRLEVFLPLIYLRTEWIPVYIRTSQMSLEKWNALSSFKCQCSLTFIEYDDLHTDFEDYFYSDQLRRSLTISCFGLAKIL